MISAPAARARSLFGGISASRRSLVPRDAIAVPDSPFEARAEAERAPRSAEHDGTFDPA
jgi:hypothetical protein